MRQIHPRHAETGRAGVGEGVRNYRCVGFVGPARRHRGTVDRCEAAHKFLGRTGPSRYVRTICIRTEVAPAALAPIGECVAVSRASTLQNSRLSGPRHVKERLRRVARQRYRPKGYL